MTSEDRLRQAIEARTSRVEPSADALHHIEEKLMDAQQHDNRKRLLIGLGSAAAILAVVVGALVLAGGDDDDPVDTVGTTTTTTAGGTTTTEGTTTTTTFAPTVDPSVPVWPRVHTSQRFDDPVSAARSFAVDFVGMTDPVVGEFQPGDPRSGEVPLQPRTEGPVTTVFLRQLEDDTWFVLGSATDDIRLDMPAVGTDIDCPVRLTGEALAFEGVVQVAIRDDVSEEPIGTGIVQGGAGRPPPSTARSTVTSAGWTTAGSTARSSSPPRAARMAESGRSPWCESPSSSPYSQRPPPSARGSSSSPTAPAPPTAC